MLGTGAVPMVPGLAPVESQEQEDDIMGLSIRGLAAAQEPTEARVPDRHGV